jgi:hypothetical protein
MEQFLARQAAKQPTGNSRRTARVAAWMVGWISHANHTQSQVFD